MEAKTLTPDADAAAGAGADAAPKTLAAGELVWAKPKGRRRVWWPARLLSACPADGARDVGVSYLGDPGAPPGPAAQVRRFADPDADGMARGSTARAFLAAVQEAHSSAVAALRASLTCGCAPPPSPEAGFVVVGVANLSPAEFLAALRDAALAGSPVGLVDRTRLKSWVRAFGEGWGPGGAGHYPRRTVEELVDKIDLDVPASEDKEDDEWLADAEDEHKALELLQKTPAQKKRRAAALMDEVDAGEDEKKGDSATGAGTSGKRERKRSKYLSPPYTNVGVIALPRKAADLPKALVASAVEYDTKVLPGGIVVEEVLSLVLGLGKDVHLGSRFPKAAESFLLSFRSSEFKCPDSKSYEVHESPVTHAIGKVDVDTAEGVISDSQTALKLGNCSSKRGRKKDGDGSASSSINKKKREKSSPASIIGCGLPITPAIPIRQVKAEDIRSQMKAGGAARGLGVGVKNEKFKPAVFKCDISPAVPEATKPGQEQNQANDGFVVKTPLAVDINLSDKPAKENDEAKLQDEKNKPSLFKCAISAAVLGAAKSEHKQQVDGFVGKTLLAVENTLSDQSARKNVEIKFGDEDSKLLVFKCPISAAVPAATEPEVHQSSVSTPQVSGNTFSDQSAKENGEAIKSETNVESILVDVPIRSIQMEAIGPEAKICIDDTMQSVVADVPVTNVSKEAKESKPNVCIDVPAQSVGADDVAVQSISANDVPVQSVGASDVPVQSVGADVPVQSVGADVRASNERSLMVRDIAQVIEENKEHTSVEMHTVQQSYASLQAMAPEMLMKVTNSNGTDVIPVNHALKDDCQKDERPNQKVKLTVGSMTNHFSDEAVNGTCHDATNSAPKKKKKKTSQLFVAPAEIIVEFTLGVIMPSREELLSAFGKFGFLIESQTNISNVTRSARVVFAKKAEAEKAYNRAEFLGQFGPPFATLRLGDLPPIELSAPSPPSSLASRPPLTDVRKNLEKMISARRSSLKNATSADGLTPVSDKLLADMQGLLAQVDKMLGGPSSSTPP
ncbi:hypothetical protein EJB05_31984, partial [Eragrostis curvula]